MSIGDPPAPANFDDRLAKAASLLGATPERLVSIKARPITKVKTYNFDGYLGSGDYEQINTAFKSPDVRLVKDADFLCGGRTRLYELKGGGRVVYVEHETGPELIHEALLVASAIGGTAFAANQVITLFNTICGIVRGRGESSPSHRDAKGRFLALSVEKRTKKAQTLIRQIADTAEATEKALHSVEDLMGGGGGH